MSSGGEEPRLDRWAEWLIRGRDALLSDEQRRHQAHGLKGLRDRVLRGARITSGDRVLDVGAGTGLLALGAGVLTGVEGAVAALDISLDALGECHNEARASTPTCLIHCVGGQATSLPFRSGSFDAVVTRSVLIYVADKQGSVDEMFRVLARGGRVSLFEPINAAARALGLDATEVPAEIASEHERVRATFQARSLHWEPMMGFDERDMVGWFIAAGFEAVGVSYELLYTRLPSDRDQTLTFLDTRGNPTAPTWREAAVEALGPDAERYLNILVDARHGGLSTGINAHVFLTATREAGSP